ncbi:MAG: MerR family transcriptional regulator [Gammaproteobacteria bacterium]|nr:MerR family transcriptional regulator [Gammaproteobacteria bacterium]
MAKEITYSISQLAKHFDITPRAIRFYEDRKLLSPERHNSHRIYKEGDLVRLKLILRGKRLGFSLEEIRKTMELYDTEPNEKTQLLFVLDTISIHRQELETRQQDIRETLNEMKTVSNRIKKKLKELD